MKTSEALLKAFELAQSDTHGGSWRQISPHQGGCIISARAADADVISIEDHDAVKDVIAHSMDNYLSHLDVCSGYLIPYLEVHEVGIAIGREQAWWNFYVWLMWDLKKSGD